MSEQDEPEAGDLIYDWNEVERRGPVIQKRRFELHDETLRDGIQNPSVVDPGIGDKLEILHLLDEVGVDTTDVGLPGAGPRAFEDPFEVRWVAGEPFDLRGHLRVAD